MSNVSVTIKNVSFSTYHKKLCDSGTPDFSTFIYEPFCRGLVTFSYILTLLRLFIFLWKAFVLVLSECITYFKGYIIFRALYTNMPS